MVTLDTERINANSPYELIPNKRPLFYDFITDYGVDYNTGFTPSNLLPDVEAYEFILTNPSNRKSPRDPKLRETILALIYEFFRKREAVMLYLCETGDNRQKIRNRLFESWFRSSGHQKAFIFLSSRSHKYCKLFCPLHHVCDSSSRIKRHAINLDTFRMNHTIENIQTIMSLDIFKSTEQSGD